MTDNLHRTSRNKITHLGARHYSVKSFLALVSIVMQYVANKQNTALQRLSFYVHVNVETFLSRHCCNKRSTLFHMHVKTFNPFLFINIEIPTVRHSKDWCASIAACNVRIDFLAYGSPLVLNTHGWEKVTLSYADI